MTQGINDACNDFNVDDLQNENVCPDLHFDGENGWMHCQPNVKTSGKIVQICVLNCNPGFVAAPNEVYLCSLNDKLKSTFLKLFLKFFFLRLFHFKGFQWSLPNGKSLDEASNVTCESPVALIVGGMLLKKVIAFYHETFISRLQKSENVEERGNLSPYVNV